jgi:hypothetical protein
MTASMEFEFEDPELIVASHLVRTTCRICGTAEALAVPEKAEVAGCAPCLAARVGAGGVYEGKPVPVVRFGTYGVELPPEVREAYPVPEAESRTPWPYGMEFPAPIDALALFACSAGWKVKVAYSRGRMPHGSTGRPGALKHLISLRFGGHPMTDRQAYAVYSKSVTGAGTWSWSSVWIWGPDLPPFGMCGQLDFRVYLKEIVILEKPYVATWVGGVRRRVTEAEVARKLKAKTTVKKTASKENAG